MKTIRIFVLFFLLALGACAGQSAPSWNKLPHRPSTYDQQIRDWQCREQGLTLDVVTGACR